MVSMLINWLLYLYPLWLVLELMEIHMRKTMLILVVFMSILGYLLIYQIPFFIKMCMLILLQVNLRWIPKF